MPLHKGWLPRQGFTADVVGTWINWSLLNPLLTLPTLLLALYSPSGKALTRDHQQAVSRLRLLVYLGVFRLFNRYMSQLALNNGVRDKYDWTGREVVVITGGSDGIGARIVLLLAEQGIKVAVLDIQPPTYPVPSTVFYQQCDIRSPAAISSAASAIRAHFSASPTILINNAGVVRGTTILETSESSLNLVFGVNTLSHYHLAREFLPAMIQADHGMIVTVSSLAAYVTTANLTDYAASKAAALAFHEGLTSELVTRYHAPRVRTILVTQGYTKTALFEGWHQDNGFLNPVLEPETVAEETVKMVLTGQSGQLLIPEFNRWMAPWLRVWPEWMALPLRNRLEEFMSGGFRGRMVKGLVDEKEEKGEEEKKKKETSS